MRPGRTSTQPGRSTRPNAPWRGHHHQTALRLLLAKDGNKSGPVSGGQTVWDVRGTVARVDEGLSHEVTEPSHPPAGVPEDVSAH